MQVGPYRIEAELGRGASGVVYRARAADTSGLVALKVIPLPRDAARLQREWRIAGELARSAHGFVPVIDAGVAGDRAWMAMPLLTGGTLRARLERGPLPVEEVLALARALSGALAAAHARDVVHRDVKPENVLFSEDARPLLADLGTAKHFASASELSRALSLSGELRGTPLYLAPEQATDATSVGPPADVYALGATLYECLTGRPPVEGSSLLELLAGKAGGAFTPVRELRPDAPPGLAQAIEHALAAEPQRRFPDARAFAAALEPGAAPRSARTPLGLVLAAGLGALVLALSLALLLAEGRGPAATTATEAAPHQAALRALEDPALGPLQRREAIERVLAAPEAASAVAAAVSSSPAAVGLRCARLELDRRAGRALAADDLALALPALDPPQRMALAVHVFERGLVGAWTRREVDAGGWLLQGLGELASGRRREAQDALVRVGPDAHAGWLRRSIEAVDRMAASHDVARCTPAEEGAVAEALRDPHASLLAPQLLEQVLEPLTERLRPLGMPYLVLVGSRDLLEAAAQAAFRQPRARDPLISFHEALFAAHRLLPPRALAAFEVAGYRRRAERLYGGEYGPCREEAERLELAPRLEAAREALRGRDDALAGEAELLALELRQRFNPGGAWDDPLVERALRLAEASRGQLRLRALERAVDSRWYPAMYAAGGAEERPGAGERFLAVNATAIAAAQAEGNALAVRGFRMRRIPVLINEGRLDELERVLDELAPPEALPYRAELARLRGDDQGALELAERELALPDLGPDRELPLRATAALALARLGRAEETEVHLSRVDQLMPYPGEPIPIGVSPRQLRATVQQLGR